MRNFRDGECVHGDNLAFCVTCNPNKYPIKKPTKEPIDFEKESLEIFSNWCQVIYLDTITSKSSNELIELIAAFGRKCAGVK